MSTAIFNHQLNNLAYDLTGLNQLKGMANQPSVNNIKQVAKVFEGLFIQMMMKQMRQTIPDSGLLTNAGSQLFTALFDQQIAQQATHRGLGLADMLIKQMMPKMQKNTKDNSTVSQTTATPRQNQFLNLMADQPSTVSADGSLFSDKLAPVPSAAVASLFYSSLSHKGSSYINQAFSSIEQLAKPVTENMVDFVKKWLMPAQKVSIKSAIPYEIIIAQAALETGWGKKEILTAEGRPSYNYFGIKADSRWRGLTAHVHTTEYQHDQKLEKKQAFRVYASHADGLADYVQLLTQNKRYQSVVSAPTVEHAALALQQANYATDPQYGAKLIQLVRRIKQIVPTLLSR